MMTNEVFYEENTKKYGKVLKVNLTKYFALHLIEKEAKQVES